MSTAWDQRTDPGQAHAVEDRDEGAGPDLVLGGGQHGDQQQDRAAVEDGDPVDAALTALGTSLVELAISPAATPTISMAA